MSTKNVITTVAVIISMLYGLAFALFDINGSVALIGAIALGIMWVVVGLLLRSNDRTEVDGARAQQPTAH